ALPCARRARRLPDDRRTRHARRPGTGAIRMVDRAAPRRSRHARRGNRTTRGDSRRNRGTRRRARGTALKLTTFDEFVDLAKRATFVPVVKELVADLLTPVSAFLKVAEHSDYAFLLESVEGGEHVGRYSFLGKDPFLILRGRE